MKSISQIIMTVIAPDRPGLVERIASLVAHHGGNWEESRMCHLGGQFAGILKVQIDNENQNAFLKEIDELEKEGIRVHITKDDHLGLSEEDLVRMRVMTQDDKGIIREISRVLVKHQANVEELHTELQNEPMSGMAMLVCQVQFKLPKSGDLRQLHDDLEGLSFDLMVDFD